MFQEDETIEMHLSEPTCVPAGLCQTEANNIWLNTGITLHIFHILFNIDRSLANRLIPNYVRV